MVSGEVSVHPPLLLQLYRVLPDKAIAGEPRAFAKSLKRGLSQFRKAVQSRYFEGTLLRLLSAADPELRQAAALALGLTGSMESNAALAARLHDDDAAVRELAADALWSLWFKADTAHNNQVLQRLMQLPVHEESAQTVLAGFNALLTKASIFAEAYNQRAVVYYRLGRYAESIADCESVLRLNPSHFGAASGMGQCYMKLKKIRAALRSYRRAHRIHPHLDGVKEVIASLVKILGETGQS